MATDFRALCAELLAWADVTAAHYIQLPDVIIRARAALAEPADALAAGAERPSDEELRDLWSWAAGQDQGPWPTQYHCFARAVLARWGHDAPVPVPVAWCRTHEFNNAMERGGSFNGWIDAGAGANQCDMRLYALPLPAPQGGEVE